MKRPKEWCPSTDCNNNYDCTCYLLYDSRGECKLTCPFYKSKKETPKDDIKFHTAMIHELQDQLAAATGGASYA